MRLLLDTHVFLWLRNEPEKVSKTALDAYQNDENSVFLSLVSIWEMQIDRLLISQAKIEKLILVSSDSWFAQYNINLLW